MIGTRRRPGGCLVGLLFTALIVGVGFFGLRWIGNNNSAVWNRVRSIEAVDTAVNRAREIDIVNRVTDSGLVDRVRNSDILYRVRNVDLDQINFDPEILQQVRDHGTLPSLPADGASCPEPLILSAEWGRHDGGHSLAVTPSDCVRTNGLTIRDDVWATLIANVPEADEPGMRDQLVCHIIGAQQKPTWNLEPWRPDVGLQSTVLALCNP